MPQNMNESRKWLSIYRNNIHTHASLFIPEQMAFGVVVVVVASGNQTW